MRAALARRLAKLEAVISPPAASANPQRKSPDFSELVEKIKADDARENALPPVEKIRHLQRKMAKIIAKAEAPPPPPRQGVVDLTKQLHALLVQDAKSGFPNEHYEIRRCEILILKQHAYPTAQLEAAHQIWSDLPWQWRHQDHPLPPDAQAIIDSETFED